MEKTANWTTPKMSMGRKMFILGTGTERFALIRARVWASRRPYKAREASSARWIFTEGRRSVSTGSTSGSLQSRESRRESPCCKPLAPLTT
jgi:hypothetical protein